MSWQEYHRKDRVKEIGKNWDGIEKECKSDGVDPYKPINYNRDNKTG